MRKDRLINSIKGQYSLSKLMQDMPASLAVVCLAAPQCIAYAMIAGIPPVMGLYAATFPTMVAALFRSSRLTVTGPTNAISLLVFIGVAALPQYNPVDIAITLAFMVGLVQLAWVLFRLENLISLVSQPVVAGYITGAGVLIGVAQLPNITRTSANRGSIIEQVEWWLNSLDQTHFPSLCIAGGTIALALGIQKIKPKWPSDMLALLFATIASTALSLKSSGVNTVENLTPISSGFPSLTIPTLDISLELIPLVIAISMLSLVESTSVSRAIATRTGEQISLRKEVLGQSLANLVAGLFSGYPTSGSLARSGLNESSQAASRGSAFLSGVWMLLILLFFGAWINPIPLPALGGLLMLIAYKLVRVDELKRIWRSTVGDRLSMVSTLIGTWVLPLDQAIYLGVAIGVLSFLYQTCTLRITPIFINDQGFSQEYMSKTVCSKIKIIQIEGALFFATYSELQNAIDKALVNSEAGTLIVRLRRTQHMDYTIASALINISKNLTKQDKRLVLVGLRKKEAAWLKAVDTENIFHDQNLFPTQTRWFDAMRLAIEVSKEKIKCEHTYCCPLALNNTE
jgi:sulfate permease, SulP family